MKLEEASFADYRLIDDGSMDTVVRHIPSGTEHRFSDTSEHRDEDGSLRWLEFIASVAVELDAAIYDQEV